MDIFVFNINNEQNLKIEDLKTFQKKNISNEKSLYTHCLAYYLTDNILEKVYNIKKREIVFKNKKPFLRTEEKYFSISHSKDYIALAFSDYDCGIDIEKIINRNYENISERMGFEAKSLNDFYKKWTEFEAKYKINNKKAESIKSFELDRYWITVVSTNPNEDFNFPNFNTK